LGGVFLDPYHCHSQHPGYANYVLTGECGMTNKLINVLENLNGPVTSYQVLARCHRNWQYNEDDEHCLQCDVGDDCHWLFTQRLGATLPDKPYKISRLYSAVSSTSRRQSYADHRDNCDCVLCRYLSRHALQNEANEAHPDGYTRQ
jgi:hypothetical protein